MRKLLIIAAISATMLFCACKGGLKDVPCRIADRYFVSNKVDSIPMRPITTQDDFDSLFGMATVMGENGKPTAIDFSNEYVLAVSIPATNRNTSLEFESLKQDNVGNMVFAYRRVDGEEMSYTIRPLLMIVVDKKYQGDIVFQEKD